MPNGRELIDELDLATALMMAIPVELVGGAEWQEVSSRQYRAFGKWREYLYCMADGRVCIETLKIA
jgi:hypothetical protein